MPRVCKGLGQGQRFQSAHGPGEVARASQRLAPVVTTERLEGRFDGFARDVRPRHALAVSHLAAFELDANHQVLALGAAMRSVLDFLLERNGHAKKRDSADLSARSAGSGSGHVLFHRQRHRVLFVLLPKVRNESRRGATRDFALPGQPRRP